MLRKRIILCLKQHPFVLEWFWKLLKLGFTILGKLFPTENKIIFASFGGRKFDDSPFAIYEEICRCSMYDNFELVWAFVNPDEFQLPRGKKVKIDTFSFFKELLTSKIWVSNSGMDRGIGLNRTNVIRVETWHGTPLKKIGGDENKTSMIKSLKNKRAPLDSNTIRCAQSTFDRDIFSRIFHATKESFLMCDLPRNDALCHYTSQDIDRIKKKVGIPRNKKVILYVPTYREYLINDKNNIYLESHINLKKWKKFLEEQYILLVRGHYAINELVNFNEDEFSYDVTNYPSLNELYLISDLLISDYSSAYFDYSILGRPMFCFAYDLEEYMDKRGLYLNLEDCLPCSIDKDENILLKHILTMDVEQYKNNTKKFHEKYTPNAGNASKVVVNEISKRMRKG